MRVTYAGVPAAHGGIGRTDFFGDLVSTVGVGSSGPIAGDSLSDMLAFASERWVHGKPRGIPARSILGPVLGYAGNLVRSIIDATASFAERTAERTGSPVVVWGTSLVAHVQRSVGEILAGVIDFPSTLRAAVDDVNTSIRYGRRYGWAIGVDRQIGLLQAVETAYNIDIWTARPADPVAKASEAAGRLASVAGSGAAAVSKVPGFRKPVRATASTGRHWSDFTDQLGETRAQSAARHGVPDGIYSMAKKKPRPGARGAAGATDAPSWVKGEAPNVGESGKAFAARMLDAKYGPGNWKKGPRSEYSQIQKWADRHFEDP
jgi:hypothetical protein